MNKCVYKKENIIAKIATASPMGLVVISFEIVIYHLNEAIVSFDNEYVKSCLKKAQKAVDYLISTLQTSYSISGNLLKIYFYCNKLIISSYFSLDKEPLKDVLEIMSTLREGFEEANKKIIKENKNQDEVFYGLTYKNNKLCEFVSQDESKGFKA